MPSSVTDTNRKKSSPFELCDLLLASPYHLGFLVAVFKDCGWELMRAFFLCFCVFSTAAAPGRHQRGRARQCVCALDSQHFRISQQPQLSRCKCVVWVFACRCAWLCACERYLSICFSAKLCLFLFLFLSAKSIGCCVFCLRNLMAIGAPKSFLHILMG